MKSFLAAAALLIGASAQILGLDLNVPPLQPDILGGILSGNALTPEYNNPREVYIFNPAELASSKGKRSGYKIVDQPSTNIASAVYTMLNGDTYNSVLAISVFPNGTINGNAQNLYFPYDSNGNYAAGARFNSNSNVTETALDSQGSLIQAGSRVFAVNAGSNSFQTYAVNCTEPNQLIMLGTTVPVNGDYPNTIAVAIENHIVCVATTGQVAGIECYNFNAGFGPNGPNPPQYFTGTKVTLPLPSEQPSGLPDGPADTVSQLLFTDDEKYLVAVVKSATGSSGSVSASGFINVYPITSNGLGNPVQTVISGSEFLFGCVFNYNTYNLLCTDPGVGAFNLTMSASTLKFSTNQVVENAQFASGSMNCWSARSPYANGPNYVAAINENYIGALNKQSGHVANVYYNGDSYVPQLTEMAVANNFVYAISIGGAGSSGASPSINVAQDLNLDGDLQYVQTLFLGGYSGMVNSYEGMQVFVPGDESNICDFT